MSTQRDIVFLFGAGASYGAGSILPERPPLGKELFRELVRVYPLSWGSLPNDIQKQFSTDDFEIGMQYLENTFGMKLNSLMWEMGLYFAQFYPVNQSSLYCRLLQFLKESNLLNRIVLSSLNYECILDFSLQTHNIPFVYDNQLSKEHLPLLKPHGGCNFFSTAFSGPHNPNNAIRAAFRGFPIQSYADREQILNNLLCDSPLAPLMSLIMPTKPMEHYSDWWHIRGQWAEYIERCRYIYCIGVHPNADVDDHIWGPLMNTQATLYYVGKEEPFADWVSKHKPKNSVLLGEYFGVAYTGLIERLRQNAIDSN